MPDGLGCLLEYKAEAFFMGSLSEPVSCIVGAYHAQYHTKGGSYVHEMGIREGGSLALLASVGPMGIGAIDYAMHAPLRPSRVVVTDIDEARLGRRGVDLHRGGGEAQRSRPALREHEGHSRPRRPFHHHQAREWA